MSDQQPTSDAVQGSSRHSTFRQRMNFAVPVVLIAGFAAGCGADDSVTTNPPPPPSTTVNVIANPPAPGTGAVAPRQAAAGGTSASAGS